MATCLHEYRDDVYFVKCHYCHETLPKDQAWRKEISGTHGRSYRYFHPEHYSLQRSMWERRGA
jgi:hypothetical protein